MPLYSYKCVNDHESDQFEAWRNKSCLTPVCVECSHSMGPIMGTSKALLYFEEGRGRWISNLADKPVYVRSHAEHKKLMKKHGVELAGNRPGTKGEWR